MARNLSSIWRRAVSKCAGKQPVDRMTSCIECQTSGTVNCRVRPIPSTVDPIWSRLRRESGPQGPAPLGGAGTAEAVAKGKTARPRRTVDCQHKASHRSYAGDGAAPIRDAAHFCDTLTAAGAPTKDDRRRLCEMLPEAGESGGRFGESVPEVGVSGRLVSDLGTRGRRNRVLGCVVGIPKVGESRCSVASVAYRRSEKSSARLRCGDTRGRKNRVLGCVGGIPKVGEIECSVALWGYQRSEIPSGGIGGRDTSGMGASKWPRGRFIPEVVRVRSGRRGSGYVGYAGVENERGMIRTRGMRDWNSAPGVGIRDVWEG